MARIEGLSVARRRFSGAGALLATLLIAGGTLTGCGKSENSSAATDAPGATPSVPMTQVPIPQVKYGPGDNLDPLAADLAYPSDDPRNLEGIWIGLGMPLPKDGKPAQLTEKVKAERARFMELERQGTPVTRRHVLCRPPAVVNFVQNQFPVQILQREDKILIITEEHRGIWMVHMNQKHPEHVEPTYGGHNVGWWEGNTLVIDSVGFKYGSGGDVPGTGGEGSDGSQMHVITRITRANNGDKRNGDRLIVERTTKNPVIYTEPYTTLNVARWRPDVEMLEFNCEESTPALTADGLVVE